ncbi:MAG: hypothetical protein ACWA5T_10310 [Parvularcula sp.]
MGAPKYASLRPDLLARKGEAFPAAPSAPPFTPTAEASPEASTANGFSVPVPPDLRPNSIKNSNDPPFREENAPSAFSRQTDQLPATKVSVRLRARHKRLLQFLKMARSLSHGEVIDRALEDYMRKLAIGEMRDCGCFMKAYLKKE